MMAGLRTRWGVGGRRAGHPGEEDPSRRRIDRADGWQGGPSRRAARRVGRPQASDRPREEREQRGRNDGRGIEGEDRQEHDVRQREEPQDGCEAEGVGTAPATSDRRRAWSHRRGAGTSSIVPRYRPMPQVKRISPGGCRAGARRSCRHVAPVVDRVGARRRRPAPNRGRRRVAGRRAGVGARRARRSTAAGSVADGDLEHLIVGPFEAGADDSARLSRRTRSMDVTIGRRPRRSCPPQRGPGACR